MLLRGIVVLRHEKVEMSSSFPRVRRITLKSRTRGTDLLKPTEVDGVQDGEVSPSRESIIDGLVMTDLKAVLYINNSPSVGYFPYRFILDNLRRNTVSTLKDHLKSEQLGLIAALTATLHDHKSGKRDEGLVLQIFHDLGVDALTAGEVATSQSADPITPPDSIVWKCAACRASWVASCCQAPGLCRTYRILRPNADFLEKFESWFIPQSASIELNARTADTRPMLWRVPMEVRASCSVFA